MTVEQLTVSELESLKRFTVTFIAVYRIMPPKELLSLFIMVQRIAQQIIEAQKAVAKITIVQAPTLNSFHSQAIANIQHSRSMMR